MIRRMKNTLEYQVRKGLKLQPNNSSLRHKPLRRKNNAAQQKRTRKADREEQSKVTQTNDNKSRTDMDYREDKGEGVQLTCIESVKHEADRINKNKRSSDNEQQKENGKAKSTKNEH
eukprot:11782486-Heterocapsa_arctica.AAC.1